MGMRNNSENYMKKLSITMNTNQKGKFLFFFVTIRRGLSHIILPLNVFEEMAIHNNRGMLLVFGCLLLYCACIYSHFYPKYEYIRIIYKIFIKSRHVLHTSIVTINVGQYFTIYCGKPPGRFCPGASCFTPFGRRNRSKSLYHTICILSSRILQIGELYLGKNKETQSFCKGFGVGYHIF